MTEEDLIFKLTVKDESGLVELINRYSGLLKSVVHKHLYALPHYQEECLNDIFLAIWDNAAKYDKTKASFKNWICAIARYRAISMLKKYQNELNAVPIEEGIPFEMNDTPFKNELWEIELDHLLAPLSQKDQALIKDVVEANLTTEEIAQKHGLTRGALYNRVSRAKAKVRRFFQKKGANHHEK